MSAAVAKFAWMRATISHRGISRCRAGKAGSNRVNRLRGVVAAQTGQACEINIGEQSLITKGLLHVALQLVQARRKKATPTVALG